jgi:hypothetical protein
VRLALLALLAAAACSHGEGALRDEQAKTRQYREAYETQAQQVQRLKARIAELEQQGCR